MWLRIPSMWLHTTCKAREYYIVQRHYHITLCKMIDTASAIPTGVVGLQLTLAANCLQLTLAANLTALDVAHVIEWTRLSPRISMSCVFKGHMLELLYAREYTQGERAWEWGMHLIPVCIHTGMRYMSICITCTCICTGEDGVPHSN